MEESRTHGTEKNLEISQEAIYELIANAAESTEGVVSLKRGMVEEITSIMGKEIVRKGVKVEQDDDEMNITVKLIAHTGYNLNNMAEKVKSGIANSLKGVMKASEDRIHVIFEELEA